MYPKLYKPSQSGELFNVKVFWIWVTNGMLHSAILYWLPLFVCQHDILWMNGKEGGYLILGNCVYTVSKEFNLFYVRIIGSLTLQICLTFIAIK